MFTVIGIMLCSIAAGIFLRRLQFCWIDKVIIWIIWLLLFLLGVEMGSNPQIISSFPTLGLSALSISIISTAGSCIGAALLAKWCRLKYTPQTDRSGKSISHLKSLKGSFIILAFIAVGTIIGYFGIFTREILPEKLSFYTLCLLIMFVGLSIGHNKRVFEDLKSVDKKVLLLPLFTISGTLAAILACSIFFRYHIYDLLAIGSGQAYYSLSSILISQSKGIELGTIALLANVMREIITLIAAPFLPKIAGPLSPIAAGGATTADTTLPIIRQVCGDDLAVISVYHGFAVDFSVPFMVALFCSL